MALSASILMIDTVALVMALKQASFDEFGYRATEIGLSGGSHTSSDLIIDNRRGALVVIR
jgi:hypothetical protein